MMVYYTIGHGLGIDFVQSIFLQNKNMFYSE